MQALLRLHSWWHLLMVSENKAVCQQAKVFTRLFDSAEHGHEVPFLMLMLLPKAHNTMQFCLLRSW